MTGGGMSDSSGCRATRDRLTPFVDGALAATEQALVERHLAACPPCRAAEQLERGGRALLQSRAGQMRQAQMRQGEMLPPGLRTRCEALAREATSTPGVPAWRGRVVPMALAVVLMVFTASAFISLMTHRSDGLLAAQLSRDHKWCFQRFAGSVSADAGEMERMFEDRYGWRVRVPPSSPAAGVQLIGAKRCVYDGRGVPHLLYRVNGEELSLYVIDGERRPNADLVADGRRSRVWSHDDTTFVLVSPTGAGEMTMAAGYLRQGAH